MGVTFSMHGETETCIKSLLRSLKGRCRVQNGTNGSAIGASVLGIIGKWGANMFSSICYQLLRKI